MKKILLMSLLVSISSILSNQVYAFDYYQGSQRVIDTYAPPKVIYVVPLNNGYAPQPITPAITPAITPSTYVAPSNTWTPIVTPTQTIDLDPYK